MPQRAVLGTLAIAGFLATVALAPSARADLTDGKPCFTYINPPGNGVRYVCTSSSSHTVEHPGPATYGGPVFRTRITARREGEPVIYDRTVDTLAAPDSDPVVADALADARKIVEGMGFVAGSSVVLSSSTESVREEPVSPISKTVTVSRPSLTSSAGATTVCVGSLGDLAQPPPPFPAPPNCALGSTPLTLRPLDESVLTLLTDRLDDTNTHARTDRYTALLTGELTTVHDEIVAAPALPCSVTPKTSPSGGFFIFGKDYACTSGSRRVTSHDGSPSTATDAFSTRITARLRGEEPPLFDVTINSTLSPDLDDAVRQALLDASRTVAASGVPVTGPEILSSSAERVTDAYLPGAAVVTLASSSLKGSSRAYQPSTVCVGDLGELDRPPSTLPLAPCPLVSWGLPLIPREVNLDAIYGDDVESTHAHVQRDVYTALTVTGILTRTHYEYVGERGERPPVRSGPQVVHPRPRPETP